MEEQAIAVEEFHRAYKRLKRIMNVRYNCKAVNGEAILDIYEISLDERKRVLKVEEETQLEAYRVAAREIERLINLHEYKLEKVKEQADERRKRMLQILRPD